MAIDTAEKRRCVAGNMPTPDGSISLLDRRQIAYNYRGMPIPVSLGGTLNINRSTLGDGLVGHWPLSQANYQGGVFVDESGEGNDGTPVNAPNFAIDNFRNSTGAIVFDVNDTVNMGNAAALNTGLGDFTIEGWLNAPSSIADYKTILNKFGASAGYTVFTFSGDLYMVLRGENDSGSANFSAPSTRIPISNNEWFHFVFVIDRTGTSTTVHAYKDGVFRGSQTLTVDGTLDNTADFRLYPSTGIVGSLSDIYIYNRILSSDEVSLLHSSGLSMVLELSRSFGGILTPTGDLARVLTAYRSLGGDLTPTGDLTSIVTFVLAMGGDLTLAGAISGVNPAWLLLDDALTWQGEWDAAASYNIEDVVLYQTEDSAEWHVFVSKTGHNVGNIPTSTSASWRRLYQEKWL